ncbi:long-chain-fatty-acid--CoA ligase [Rhodococcus sp. PAMC28707]|uniref:class I adenylate-forming enzyme family protein n=1 Tax=unclassified Rhodococcus (in: high G+C Gram-positive bacteria) TaxID=192944 RepID=UPI00109DEDDD|nr:MULTISPECIES: long-chain-fatty-acid--CoA ligase [unclassified Rhodococcus (in: high G+C Gram-positive bacteria)]QCB50034.1 long-chain-fatty-acid--CoA ligase [Rhodococcus sp. PAMC28705]QCB58271.1 long-chain-fatty-acid--CoA ligase [Rhodococcus sp. PAMC28707]
MPTIGSALTTSAQRCPDRTALVYGDTRRTYRELDAEVNRAAHALAKVGLTKGDRFALMAGNSDRFVIAFYAAVKLGAVVVPINPRSAPPELRYLLEDSGATVLAFDSTVAAVVHEMTEASPNDDAQVLLLALGVVEGYPSLAELAEQETTEHPDMQVLETDDSLILYTSGTTGKPKGALFDHHRTIWVGVSITSLFGITDGDRLLHVAPLYHAAELTMMLIPGTMVGATHVILPAFDPAAVLEVFESEKITGFFGVPTMYQLLLRQPDLGKRDLSSWRTGIFGAAPMPAAAVERLLEALPQVELYQACGQTEGGPGGIYSRPAEVRAKPSASGRSSLLATVVRVVDPEGKDVPAGSTGELIMQGETVMKGYWNKPAETADAIRDGWLHTGDLANVDSDGYITLVDRMKDMIITGGRNVYSVEVESALAGLAGVADCAVVGRKNEEYGETIVAIVTPLPGCEITLEDLREGASKLISNYKLPRELVIAEIPRNPSGKILKHKLRDRLTETFTSDPVSAPST